MINLELLNENESIDLKLKENSASGTSDYNELSNKPKVNGVELQGDLTTEDLGIESGGVVDVQINGASIVENGVANLPMTSSKSVGLVQAGTGLGAFNDGRVYVLALSTGHIDSRTANRFLPGNTLDYAVKCAMTDGKGPEWTSQEKASARERIGLDVWEEIVDITITEEVTQIILEFENPYREIYAYISQDGVTEVDTGNKYIYALLQNDTKNLVLRQYTGAKLTTALPDVIFIAVNHNDTFIECFNATSNAQKNSTTYDLYTKCFDRVLCDKIKNYETFNFYGLFCNVCKIGTRIRVLGVRA